MMVEDTIDFLFYFYNNPGNKASEYEMICALFHFPIIITHETHLLPVHRSFHSHLTNLVHYTIPHPFPDRMSTIILKPNSRKYIISPVLETMAHDSHFLSFFIFVLHPTVFAPLDSHWPVYTIYHHMWKLENKLLASRCRQVGQKCAIISGKHVDILSNQN